MKRQCAGDTKQELKVYLALGHREREAHRAHCAPRRNKGTFSIWSLGWRTPKTIPRPLLPLCYYNILYVYYLKFSNVGMRPLDRQPARRARSFSAKRLTAPIC